MRRSALALVGLAGILAVGCGQQEEQRRSGAQADVVRVTCGQRGTEVLTPVVQAQLDGVHLAVTNETARAAHVTIERGPSDAAGFEAPPGASEHVLAVGPGDWVLTCYAGEAGAATEPAPVEVVDTGIWVPTELTDCETEEATHGDPPRRVTTDRGELVALARRSLESFVSIDADVVIEPAGYPEQAEAIFRARKDDRIVATMSFYPDDAGGWLEGDARSCPDPPVGASSEGA
jgi:hypothetical protein